MKKNTKGKRLVLKRWIRILIFLILCLLILTSMLLIYFGLFPKKDTTPYYNYEINRDSNYKVYLLENEFYESNYIDKNDDKKYPASLIDYIDIDMRYLFNASSMTNMNYSYSVNASIIGKDIKNKKSELWTKNYNLLEQQNKSVYDTTVFDINQNLKINYQDYNKIVEDYKQEFKLSIDAYLSVKLDIKYDGVIQKNKKVVKGTDSIIINIPLTDSMIKIETKYKPNTTKSLIPSINDLRDMRKIYLGIILLSICIILFILLHDKIFISKKTYYTKVLNKLLKKYANIIVETSTLVNLDEYEVLDITNFVDMLDLQGQLKSPILLYEVIENKESWFIVINGNCLYRYVLNSSKYNK